MPIITTARGSQYMSFDEKVSNDGVRAFVPLKMDKPATVLWFMHSFGESHDSLLSAFAYQAERAVDNGWIAVCPNLGGSLFTGPKAQSLLKADYAALVSRLAQNKQTIANNIMIGSSHGGAMAIFAAGTKMLPNIRGVYSANGVYDLKSTKGRFGSMMGSYAAANGALAFNPADIDPKAFDMPVRVTYDLEDPIVNARQNGVRFITRVADAGGDASYIEHHNGHATAPGGGGDQIKFVERVIA